MKVKKGVLLDIIIASIQAGKYPSQIAREQQISKQKVNYYIRKLKDEGMIKKKGYGVWETNFYLNQVAKTIRGHAFLWKIKIPKQIDWKVKIIQSKVQYRQLENKVIRIFLNGRKIWLGKKNVIIYEPESFFGRNAPESLKFAIFKLLKSIHQIENKLNVNLRGKDGYSFSIARQHYSLIKNCLAQQCNEKGVKIKVYHKRGLWFLIDNSYNLDEAETVNKDSAISDNIGIQNYFNDHKKHNFKVTPSFLLNGMKKVTDNQMMFAKNIEKHMDILQEMGKTLKKIQHNLK